LSLPTVEVQRQSVDAERVREQVQTLTVAADAVGSAQPQGVVEVAVDAPGVVAARVEPVEVGVTDRDRAQVLGAVEVALRIVGVAVEPDGDGPVPPPWSSGNRWSLFHR
jgi:hypothetical protein